MPRRPPFSGGEQAGTGKRLHLSLAEDLDPAELSVISLIDENIAAPEPADRLGDELATRAPDLVKRRVEEDVKFRPQAPDQAVVFLHHLYRLSALLVQELGKQVRQGGNRFE